MRDCSPELEADLASKCTSLARLWTVTRTDGPVFRFTDGSKPITYSSEVYRSDISFTSSAIFLAASFANAQNVQVLFVTDDDGISQDDVRQRRFQGATCRIELINYLAPEHGTMVLFDGTVGQAEISDKGVARIDFTPNGVGAAGAIGDERFSRTCRNSFGDATCTKDLDALKVAFTLDAVSGYTLTATEFDGQATDYWALGYILWESGENVGLRNQVASSAGPIVRLVGTPGKPIQVGDTGTIFPGCDKVIETCRDKWDNVPNFRGEPEVPITLYLPQIPVSDTRIWES